MPSRNSKDKRPATSDVAFEAPKDFLVDPALWLDKLPQPFRMIDEVLNAVLDIALEDIEQREAQRQLDRARVKIPEITNSEIAGDIEGARAIVCGKDGLVYVATSTAVCVLGHDGSRLKKPLQHETATAEGISKLVLGFYGKIHIIAALADTQVLLFAHTGDYLVLVNQIAAQVDGSKIVDLFLSPSCSHLSLTTQPVSSSDDDKDAGCGQSTTLLEVHKLPLDSWSKELKQYTERKSSEDNLVSESQLSVGSHKSRGERQENVYSKPAFQSSLQPPNSLAACTAKDPSTALQNVLDGCCEHIATGEHHILSQLYFENRRKAFVSRRVDFVSDTVYSVSYKESTPTVHYLYYKDMARQPSPSFIALWWSKHSQLFIYSLESTNKGGVLTPYRVLPQSCAIVGSAVSLDTSLLALAMQNGIIAIYNLKTGLCVKVVPAVTDPDEISAIEFLPVVDTPLLAIGTTHGQVILTACDHTSKASVRCLNQRMMQQKQGDIGSEVLSLKLNPALPSTITTVHADGSIILWSSSKSGSLCRLVLPPSLAALASNCCYTSDGRNLALIARPHHVNDSVGLSDNSVVATFGLSSACELKDHWTSTVITFPLWDEPKAIVDMVKRVEMSLVEFTKQKLVKVQQKRWQSRWNEFSQELLCSQT